MNHTLADLATENINDSTPFALLVDVLDLVLAFSEQCQSTVPGLRLLDSQSLDRRLRVADITVFLAYADPNLPLTCIASILDMQTISGCFHIFAYLESRFERLTAVRPASPLHSYCDESDTLSATGYASEQRERIDSPPTAQ